MLLSLVVVGGFWFALRTYRSRSGTGSTTAVETRPPQASWQAGRWDTDPRHAYIANIGDGAAYDVSVTASSQVVGTAQNVPPYRADQLSSSSDLPCYVNFNIDPSPANEPDRFEVVVRWLAEDGERLTETVRSE
jgi:hypothetical protein